MSGSDHLNRGRAKGTSRKKKKSIIPKILAVGILVCAVISVSYFLINKYGKNFKNMFNQPTNIEGSMANAEGVVPVMVDQIDITGLTKEEARSAIEKAYPWNIIVTLNDQSYQVPDLLAEVLDSLLETIYQGKPSPVYTLDLDVLEDSLILEVENMASLWNRPPTTVGIVGFDKEKNEFLFGEGEKGLSIDQVKLVEELKFLLSEKKFDSVVTAPVQEITAAPGENTSTENYKIISTYTTKTTANSNRNTNIRLSAEALNGIIIKPGEEFSFNKTVGQRTAKKGYKSATAYSNGEVVQEIGGGVCQVSSTLYNAVVIAGLESTKRQSHTFEPSYVTPGMDAAVSYDLPDYRFKNNSNSSIGMLVNYSDRTMTVSIYGLPILEEGVEYSLKSKKLSNLGAPAPTYVEDASLPFGKEVVKSSGSGGSRWETRLVITKNGEVISQDVDHVVTYKGHAPVIARNSAAVPETPSIDPIIPTDGITVPESSSSEVVIGPGNGSDHGPGVGPGGESETSSADENSSNGPGAGPSGDSTTPVPVGPGA